MKRSAFQRLLVFLKFGPTVRYYTFRLTTLNLEKNNGSAYLNILEFKRTVQLFTCICTDGNK